jgi:hypothetical protein
MCLDRLNFVFSGHKNFCKHWDQQSVAKFAQVVIVEVQWPAIFGTLASAIAAEVGKRVEDLHATPAARFVLGCPGNMVASMVFVKRD